MDEGFDIENLYSLHQKKVYNIALNLVQSIEDAEDITQEVFLEIHRSIHNFNHQSMITTWIYRIAVNKSLDLIKSKKTKKRFAFITQLFHPQTGEQLYDIGSFIHPGIDMERKEESRFLYHAINKLNENQKTAYTLSQIQHFSQKEISSIMNLSEKAIESLIQRAKANLRNQLSNIYTKRRK